MSRVLIVALALAGVLAGALWYALSAGERGSTAKTVQASNDAASANASSPTALVPPAQAPESMPASPAPASAPQREVARSSHEEELARAHWVDGRVVLPPGTPADEELFVTADGRGFDDKSDQRVKVARDGTFRVAFSEKSTFGRFQLEGRYLYLPEIVRWKRETPQPIVLEPLLGGRIEVRVVPPPGVEANTLGGKLVLRARGTKADYTWVRDHSYRDLPRALALSFDGLAPEPEYRVGYDGGTCVGTSGAIEVAPGATRSVELALHPGVVVSGVVLDESRAPLAEAQVQATVQSPSTFSGPERFRTAETPADGGFRVGALAPGDVRLEVRLDGYETAVLELEDLAGGDARAGLELVLSRGSAIAGTVTWPDGTPAEASIQLQPRYFAFGWNAEIRELQGKCDASGHFRITGVNAESYRVRAQATKTEEITVKSEITGRDRKKTKRTPFTAEIDDVKPGTEGLALTLSTGLAVSGRVRDDLGAPLADFRISSERVAELEFTNPLQAPGKSFRDTDGSFVLDGFPEGEWRLYAEASGHARSEGVRVTFPVTEPIELVVPREARVSGVVLDAAGAPCAHVAVRTGSAAQYALYERGQGGVHTDANGAFELDELPPGRLALTASATKGAPSEPVEVELTVGQEITGVVLRLRLGATIAGEVVGRDGSPRADVEVQIYGFGTRFSDSTSTGASGRFELAGIPAGQASVQAEFDGLELRQVVTLTDGETAHVRLAPPAGTLVHLHGHVRAGGAPLAKAQISARHTDASGENEGGSSTSSSVTTDADGAYELVLPGPGRHELQLYLGGEAGFSLTAPVDVPEVADFVFDLDVPLGHVTGRVTDSAGDALPGIHVEAEPSHHEGGAFGGANGITDDDGRYDLAVPADTYVVTAGDSAGWNRDDAARYVRSRTRDVVVSASANTRGIDFVLIAGGTLTGSVRNAGGGSAGSAWIYEQGAQGLDDLQWSTGDGTFQIDGLAPGTHWIGASGQTSATRAPVAVVIEVGKSSAVELVLEPARYVHVRAHGADGKPLGCEIEVVDGAGRAQPNRGGSEPGEAWVGPLASGHYTVRARREEKSVERPLEIEGVGEAMNVELAFE